ncbi:MAG: carbohydrate binding family 9 domain-containing protein [Gemmatimonadetes bacterium]|nr:carbohydrate binding family 9 domain-containing protein [Gemmatimonadota bacterium]
MDGVVKDDEWKGAPVLGDFVQFQPERGARSKHRTEVRVLYDSTTLYVALRAWDAEPVIAQLTRRDASLDQDDAFAVLLDTYGDRQSAYFFAVNALGTQADLRIVNDGRTQDASWDAPWTVRARLTPEGWEAELAIPFSSVRFEPGRDRTWRVNFLRSRRRTFELSHWSGPVNEPYQVSTAGELSGLNLARPPRRLEGIAYGLSRSQEGSEPFWDAGLDLRWALTPGISLVGTVNPDFATIESDRETVNLTRFELSLPEKRPFFLEGAELFRQRIQTFYSRRIADIGGGGRVVGKRGPWTFSLMGADAEARVGTDSVAAAYSVGRVQRAFGRSSVGATWAERRIDGSGQGSAGLDATLFFTKTLGFTGQLIQSYGPYDDGTAAFFLRPSYDSPTGHFHVRYTHLGERFGDNVNAIGFVRDDNRRELDAALEKKVWLESGSVEQLGYDSNYNIYWGQDGSQRSWQVDQSVDFQLRNGWSLAVGHSEEFKRFEKDFRNRATELKLGYNTREYRSATAGAKFGRNFDADFLLLAAGARLKPTAQSSVEYQLERLMLDPDPSKNSTWIHVVRASQFFTSDLYLQAFYQTNSVIDRHNLHAVFVWRYDPPFGTVQLAFQRGTAAFGQASQQGNTLFLKATRVF